MVTDWSHAQRLAFDRLVVAFWQEYEAISNERVIVRDTEKQPKQGETWGPKHATVGAVLTEYRKRHDAADSREPAPLPIDLDALTAALPSLELF